MIDLCAVSYNTKKLTKRLIDTLKEDTKSPPVWRLVVIDNASNDGTPNYLRENTDLDFAYNIEGDATGIAALAESSENLGYAEACNTVGDYFVNEIKSKSDIIGFLNCDVWLTNEDLIKIEEIFKANPDIHILGPKQRDEKGNIVHGGIVGTETAPKHRGWHVHDPDDTKFKDQVECVTVSGSAYFMRRDVYEALDNDEEYRGLFPNIKGPFLPTPHYYEETFVSYLARHRGYHVYYDGSVSIGHSWHASHEKGSEYDQLFSYSKSIFVKTCDALGIEHD